MKTVQILEPSDVIQADDFIRQLFLDYDGQSDYLPTSSAYSGRRINRLGWIRASEMCPAWVGKSVQNACMDEFNTPSHEFMRGDIPRSHWEPK